MSEARGAGGRSAAETPTPPLGRCRRWDTVIIQVDGSVIGEPGQQQGLFRANGSKMSWRTSSEPSAPPCNCTTPVETLHIAANTQRLLVPRSSRALVYLEPVVAPSLLLQLDRPPGGVSRQRQPQALRGPEQQSPRVLRCPCTPARSAIAAGCSMDVLQGGRQPQGARPSPPAAGCLLPAASCRLLARLPLPIFFPAQASSSSRSSRSSSRRYRASSGSSSPWLAAAHGQAQVERQAAAQEGAAQA